MKKALIFCTGLIMGAVSGFVVSKIYLEKKYAATYDRQIAEMEQYYNQVDQYARRPVSDEDRKENTEKEAPSRADGPLDKEARKAVREKLYEDREKVNYTKYYKEDVDPAENEHPEEDPSDDDIEETPEYAEVEAWFDEYMKNRDKPPELISAETYSNLPSCISQTILYYYRYDSMLTDENMDPLEEPERFVGSVLDDIEFSDGEGDDVVYVLNYELSACYEVARLEQSWTDTH